MMKNTVHPAPASQVMGGPSVVGAPVTVELQASQIPDIHELKKLEKLYVQQKIDLLELFAAYDVSNQYQVYLSEQDKNSGSRWLYAKEKSSCFQRVCIPRLREFSMDVGIARQGGAGGGQSFEEQLGLTSSEFVYPMISLFRPCFFCLSEIQVKDGRNSGQHLGTVKESCTNLIYCWPLRLAISMEGKTEAQYTMKGPCTLLIHLIGQCPCRGPFNFDVTEDSTGRKVGTVANVPTGCCKMCFTNADDYEVIFEPDATAEERAVLLGSTFLLDARFFEAKNDNKKNNVSFIG
jgi:hypothetical protein